MKKRLIKILRWSEQYTKTDMVYLAHGGFWTMLGYAVQVLGGIIITVALANLIPRETYGTYQFVISTAAVLGVFTLTGMGSAINRAVAQGKPGTFRSGIRTKLKWSIGIVLASGAVAGYYFYQGNDLLGYAFLIAGATTPLIDSFRMYDYFLNGQRRFKEAAILGSIRKLFPIVAILIALTLTDNVLILLATHFVSNAFSFLLMYGVVVYRHRPPVEADADAVGFSKHLSVIAIFSKAASHADKILIWHFLGAISVAIFTVAQLATRYSGSLLNTLSGIALPKLATRDLPTLQRTLPRKVLLFSGVMAIATMLYIALAPFVFDILFPEYPASVAISQALALTLLFIPRSLYSKALTAHACTRELYLLGIINPTIKLTALAICLPLFGLWGAVYAFIISGALEALVVYTLFKRATPKKVPAADPDATHANQE